MCPLVLERKWHTNVNHIEDTGGLGIQFYDQIARDQRENLLLSFNQHRMLLTRANSCFDTVQKRKCLL